jgi:hypothetical protein
MIISYFILIGIALTISQVGLKIWGPVDYSKGGIQSVNIIRIMISLLLVYYTLILNRL